MLDASLERPEEGRKNKLLKYYQGAKEFCIQDGYGEVVNDVFERINRVAITGDCLINAEDFFFQYVYAVLNSGISNKAAESMYCAFLKDLDVKTIKHDKKRDAISKAISEYRAWFHEFTSLKCSTVEAKLEYLATLPFMGKANQFLVLRNLGYDVVKPDVHLLRLTKIYGFKTPTDLCMEIRKSTGEYLGVIDLILWYYCSRTRDYTGDHSHAGAMTGNEKKTRSVQQPLI